jgi:hypothetical protein
LLDSEVLQVAQFFEELPESVKVGLTLRVATPVPLIAKVGGSYPHGDFD